MDEGLSEKVFRALINLAREHYGPSLSDEDARKTALDCLARIRNVDDELIDAAVAACAESGFDISREQAAERWSAFVKDAGQGVN